MEYGSRSESFSGISIRRVLAHSLEVPRGRIDGDAFVIIPVLHGFIDLGRKRHILRLPLLDDGVLTYTSCVIRRPTADIHPREGLRSAYVVDKDRGVAVRAALGMKYDVSGAPYVPL